MSCGCEVTLTKGMDDARAELWLSIFGKLSFPLKHPFRFLNPNFPGKTFYAGDASAFNPEQKERFVKAMMEKFHLKSPSEVEGTMKNGIIPILADNLILSICETHIRYMMPDFGYDENDDQELEDNRDFEEDEEL